MAVKLKGFNVNLPFNLGGVNIEVSEGNAKAAWALYIELATRISTQALKKGDGSVREALSSIYSLFETTRTVLQTAGPDAASRTDSIGPIAIRILNKGIRPFLVKWHTSLSAYEDELTMQLMEKYGGNCHRIIDEGAWLDGPGKDFYDTLRAFQKDMCIFLYILEELAGIKENLKLSEAITSQTQIEYIKA